VEIEAVRDQRREPYEKEPASFEHDHVPAEKGPMGEEKGTAVTYLYERAGKKRFSRYQGLVAGRRRESHVYEWKKVISDLSQVDGIETIFKRERTPVSISVKRIFTVLGPHPSAG